MKGYYYIFKLKEFKLLTLKEFKLPSRQDGKFKIELPLRQDINSRSNCLQDRIVNLRVQLPLGQDSKFKIKLLLG
jgi:hypothetical protein